MRCDEGVFCLELSIFLSIFPMQCKQFSIPKTIKLNYKTAAMGFTILQETAEPKHPGDVVVGFPIVAGGSPAICFIVLPGC